MVCISVLGTVSALICGGIVGCVVGGLIGAALSVRNRSSLGDIQTQIKSFAVQGAIYGALGNIIVSLLLCWGKKIFKNHFK